MDKKAEPTTQEVIKNILDEFQHEVITDNVSGQVSEIPGSEMPASSLIGPGLLAGGLGLGALGLGGYGAYKLGQRNATTPEDEGTAEEEEMAKSSSLSDKESLFIDGFFETCHERGLAPESAAILFKESFAPSRSTPVGDITQHPAKYEKQADFRPTTLTRPFLEGFYRTCYDQGLTPEVASNMHKQAMIEEFKARSPAFEQGFEQTMYKFACSQAALS